MPVLAFLAVAWLASCATTDSGETTAQAAPSDDARALGQGERLYTLSCAGCHGANARGKGPVAPLLDASVPDLTLIASRRGGSFPADEIYKIIDGQADLRAHGPRHMPVWGYELFGEDADDEAAHRDASEKIDHMVHFLRSIQRTE